MSEFHHNVGVVPHRVFHTEFYGVLDWPDFYSAGSSLPFAEMYSFLWADPDSI